MHPKKQTYLAIVTCACQRPVLESESELASSWCMRNVCKETLFSVMRACQLMGQTQKLCMAQGSQAAKAQFRAAASAKPTDNSLDSLYEVVRAQQPHEGCPLSPQQVELICNVIGEGLGRNTRALLLF